MCIVDSRLALRSRADCTIERTWRNVVLTLYRIPKEQTITVGKMPVHAFGAQQIVQRCGSESPRDSPACEISYAHQGSTILIAVFKRAKKPRLVFLIGPPKAVAYCSRSNGGVCPSPRSKVAGRPCIDLSRNRMIPNRENSWCPTWLRC